MRKSTKLTLFHYNKLPIFLKIRLYFWHTSCYKLQNTIMHYKSLFFTALLSAGMHFLNAQTTVKFTNSGFADKTIVFKDGIADYDLQIVYDDLRADFTIGFTRFKNKADYIVDDAFEDVQIRIRESGFADVRFRLRDGGFPDLRVYVSDDDRNADVLIFIEDEDQYVGAKQAIAIAHQEIVAFAKNR